MSTPGQRAYTEDCRRRPTYHDGVTRAEWSDLSPIVQETWERNPTPRDYQHDDIRQPEF